MAALGAQSIASSYEQLLHVDADGGGNTTTHVSVKDGDNGTTFGFTIASDALMMSSTNRLEFGDTGTYIFQSADGVLDLVSDTEIEINATTIDMNGALDLSGNAQLSGTVTVGADGSGTDVIFYSGTAGDNLTWDASDEKLIITGTDGQTALDVADGNVSITDDLAVDGTSNLDNTDIDGTLAVDGATISLDATTSFNIDNTNTSNGVTINTATSGGPISIGHATSETTVNDNLVVTGDIDLAGSIDCDGTANLDNTDIDGTLTQDAGAVVFNEAGADYDFRIESDDNVNMFKVDAGDNTVTIKQEQAAVGLKIDQDGNGDAIQIDFEGTSGNCIEIQAPTSTTGTCLLMQNANALTTGGVAEFHSDSSDTSTRNIVAIQNDHASATGATALKVTQDAASHAMFIDQNGNDYALEIDAENTTGTAFEVVSDALTTGKVAQFYSASSDTSTRNLVTIINDHASATGTTALKIQQDAAQEAFFIDQNGNNKALAIDSEGTTSATLDIQADVLTTGSVAFLYSNSSDASSRKLVEIKNDHASADDTFCLFLTQDGAQSCIQDSNGAVLTAAGVWSDASDILRKKDIVDLPYGLAEVLQMEPKKYVYKHKDINGIGFIAQEMELIIPEIVSGEDAYLEDVLKEEAVEAQDAVLYVEGDELPEGVEVGDVKTEAVEAAEAVIEKDTIMGGKSIAYSQLTATLVKAIQELTARVVALEG